MQNKTRNASLPLDSETLDAASSRSNSSIPRRRYWHYAIFLVLVLSSFFNLQALWGLFFIGLTIPAYRNRAVFFLDMIERDKEPIFYWAVFVTWIIFGVLMVLGDWTVISPYLT